MVPQVPTTCLFLFPCGPGLRTPRVARWHLSWAAAMPACRLIWHLTRLLCAAPHRAVSEYCKR